MSKLPRGWAETPLDELTEPSAPICYGVLKPGERDPDGIPMVRVTDIRGDVLDTSALMMITSELDQEFARSRVKSGDVLVSVQGTVGRVAIAPSDMPPTNISRTIARVRPVDGGLAPWIWAALRSPVVQRSMEDMTGGTTRDSLNIGTLRTVPVPVAPLAEQRRIVAKLNALTARTARVRADLDRVPVLAASYRRAVLVAAFSGELTRSWRASNLSSAWSKSELEAARQRESEALGTPARRYTTPEPANWSPEAALPKEWRWVSIDQLAPVTQYGTSAKTTDQADVPVLRMGNIVDGKLDLSSLKYLPSSHDEFPQLLLDDGDLLFNRTNSAELVGKSAIYRGESGATSFASYLIRLKVVGYIPELLAAYINSPWGRAWVAASTTQQVGQANVNGTKLKGLGVPFMSGDEQAALWSAIKSAFAEIDRLVAEASAARRLLDRLDQAILAKAFRGELVPQDPADEPASALLDRIRAQRAAAPVKGRRGRPTVAA